MHRLFAAIRPPEVVRDQLMDLMEESEALRWQDDEQLHVTLRFIGNVERPLAEDLAAALESIRFEPFELRVSGVGRFAKRRGGALWAGVAPRGPLAQLAAKVDRACVGCGLEPEHRAYHPHVTLARWNGPEPDLHRFMERHGAVSSLPWLVDSFILFESHLLRHGAHYEAIASYRAS